MLNLPKIGSFPTKGLKSKPKSDSSSKKITERDLEESRAKIRAAASELEIQLNAEVAKVKNWPETVKLFPLEIFTGIFAAGFMIGSGILGEIKSSVFFSNSSDSSEKTYGVNRTHPAENAKRRRSIPRILFGFVRGFIRPLVASVITATALNFTKKKAE